MKKLELLEKIKLDENDDYMYSRQDLVNILGAEINQSIKKYNDGADSLAQSSNLDYMVQTASDMMDLEEKIALLERVLSWIVS